MSDGGFGAGAVWRPSPGKRGAFLHARLVQTASQGVRVRRLGGSRAGEIRLTRFLRNPAVSPAEMAVTAARRTAERCVGRRILAIQDTTVVRSDGGGGHYLHVVLAVDAEDGAILGLIDAAFLHRTAGRKQLRHALPIEQKQSQRWLDGAQQSAEVCADAAQVTVIADRESDIYEAFAQRPPHVDLLVRAMHDRSLDEGDRLFARIDAQPIAGRVKLSLPAKPGRRARDAQLAVRFAPVQLARPKAGGKDGLAVVNLHMVDLREVCPPPGEPAVHWRLLVTKPVSNLIEAMAVADLYRRRWAIEQLFRTLKTQGFDVETIDINDDAPRSCLIMAALVAAVSVQQLVHARDGGPGPLRPMTDAFEPEDLPLLRAHCRRLEGKTERQKNPHPEGSLAYASWICARLGGWTGYYGKPGPIVMLNGWTEFQIGRTAVNTLIAHDNV